MDFTPETIKEIERLVGGTGTVSIGPNDEQVRLVPDGMKIQTLEDREQMPSFIGQQTRFHTVESFTEYVNMFKAEYTRIFAEPGHIAGGAGHITAVLDYHDDAVNTPNRCKHVAVFKPVMSEQWNRWHRQIVLNQLEFAEFIEENREDITEPESARLLDMVSNFKANRKQTFDSVAYQSNGDIKLSYQEETEANGSTIMPASLKIGIPVHFQGKPYSILVFLRHALEGGRLQFRLKMDRPEYYEDHAFKGIVEEVEASTTIKPFIGATASMARMRDRDDA